MRAALLFMIAAASAAPGSNRPSRPLRTADTAPLPRMTRLADHVYFYEQLDPTKQGVTANNLIVVTDEGVLVADGQGTVANVQRLVSDIAALTPRPIRFVVIGSEHGDHTGGDEAFPASATFLVHPRSRAAIEKRIKRAAEPVDDTRVLRLGGIEVDVMFLGRAHTGGDLQVYLPQQKLLFTSEVFSNAIFPSMANGFPTEWIETLKRAEQLDVDLFVPAHCAVGAPPLARSEERQYRGALERVVAEGRRLHDAKVPVDAAAASADFGEFTGWWRRAENAPGALKRVYMELDGQLEK